MKTKIKKSNVQDILELNMIQEGMLYHYLRESEQNVYNVQLSFRLEGDIDHLLLKKAFEYVQSNNEALRSVFSWEKLSRPVQIIFKDTLLDFSWFDMADVGKKAEEFVTDYLAADRLRRFDLSQLPLRVSLIRTAPRCYLLIITHHHILYDGWSTGILLEELLDSYQLLARDLQPEPPLKPAYKQLLRRDPEGMDEWWMDYLAGIGPNSYFAKSDTMPKPDKPIRTAQVKMPIDHLEAFCRKNKVTPASVLYAAYGILLALDNNTEDVVFGMTVSDRDTSVPGNEKVIGNFINTLPLRLKDPGDKTLWQVVAAVSEDLRSRTEYNSVSYGRIKQLIGMQPADSLFDSVMVVENYPLNEKRITKGKDFRVQSVSVYENTGIPMLVTAFLKEELEINLSYKEGAVAAEYVKAFAGRLSYIIDEIIRNKHQKAGLLSLLLPTDIRTIKEANHTAAGFPEDETIISLFDQQVKRTPDHIALRWDGGVLNYKELKTKSERMAAYLREVKGVRPGDLVGVMLGREEALILSIFGVLRSGAAYLPLDPNAPAGRNGRILADAGVKLLITRRSGKVNSVPGPDHFSILDIGREWPVVESYEPMPIPRFESDRLAYVIYTSGSTGIPKGVMIEHRSVVNRILWMQKQYPLGYADVILQKTPVVFDVSVWELFWWSFTGASLSLLQPGGEKDPRVLAEAIRRHGVTTLHFVPAMLEVFLHATQEEPVGSNCGSLRQVFASGEALKPEQVNLFSTTLCRQTGARLINLYGPTEATVDVSYYECPMEYTCRLVPIGKPIDNIRLYIVNKWLQPVPVGVPGELCIAGVGLARGYLNNKALTDEKFVAYPAVPGERIYRTGDLARWLPDGNIAFLGRIDHQVKIRGFRIEPGEIEQALAGHESVRSSLVMAREPEGEKCLVAWYTAPTEIPATELRSFLAGRLPEYMVPTWFVHLDSFPVTANGKIDRKALPDPYTGREKEFIAPAGGTETVLAGIWSTLLGLPVEDIGAHRSFFELGGHSLRATTLVGKINREFGVALQLNDVFRCPTIAGLAHCIRTARPVAYAPIEPAGPADFYPLSPMQRRLYFLHQLDRNSLAYNMPYVMSIEGDVDPERLQSAFQRLIRRHEIFRTNYIMHNDEPVQQVASGTEFILERLQAADAGLPSAIRSFIRSFSLDEGPLLRAALITATDTGRRLLAIDMHHIVSDGPSRQVIVHDFMALYNGGQLPDQRIQYKDFAVWQAASLAPERLSKAREFWLREYADEAPVLGLPTDYARPAVKDFAGDTLDFNINKHMTQQLKALADAEGGTLFMVLLSIYSVLLSKLSGQENIVTGVPVAGREHTDLEQMVGLFIATLPIRHRCRAGQSFRQFLEAVRVRTLAALNNQAFPYESLIDALKVERDTSRNPLFDAAFFMQNFEGAELAIPGVTFTPFSGSFHPVSKFDLTLIAEEKNDQLWLTFEYATSLFSRETVQRFSGYFNQVVAAVLQDPGQLLAGISLPDALERQELLIGRNATGMSYDREATIVSLFRQQAMRTPLKTAVVYEGRRLSYGELDGESEVVGQRLRQGYGVGPGRLVGVMLGRSERLLVGLLGILKAGGAYVPLDPTYPRERLEYMLSDSGAEVLVSDRSVEGLSYGGSVVLLEELLAGPEEVAALPPAQPAAGDLCYVIYTSGSTGRPKGVMITHGNVVNFFGGIDERIAVGEDERLLAVTSTSFDISVLELFWTLCRGIEIVMHPGDISLNGLDRYVEERALDFSLFFFSSYEKDKREDKYKLLVEAVRYADEAGFEAVWTPERHFHEFGGLYPNPSVISAGLSMVTRRIGLRSGSVVSPLHDSIRIAEEWSVVDNLSGGRVGLSFASGWNADDFVLSGGDYSRRQQKMYEQIEEVRRLWRGEEVRRVNGQGREVGVRIYPRPIQETLPVWVTSAGSKETFISAGRAGANVLTHLLGQDMEMLAVNIGLYREARRASGYDGGKVTIMLHTYIGEETGEVERLVAGPFIEYLKSSIALSKAIFEREGVQVEELSEEVKEKMLRSAFLRYYKTGSLIGTKGSCGQVLEQLREMGVDEMACLVDFGLEAGEVLSGLKRLNELRELYGGKGLCQGRVTMLQSTPSFVRMVEEGRGSGKFLGGLRTLLLGGEAVSVSLVRRLQESYKGLEVYNMYGPTETTIWSCVHRYGGEEKMSIGRPLGNQQVYVLDESGRLVGEGVAGELYIGGEGLSVGYWGKGELTAERFVDNRYRPGERLYRTGDRVRWMEGGILEYLGRGDEQVKIRGHRIELGEIESRLRGYGGIREAVVTVKEGAEGDKVLVGYVVSAGEVEEAELRKYLSGYLPQYMIPGHLVRLEQLPLTLNGKIDRKALPDPIYKNIVFEAPQTHEERLLVEVWSKVLGEKQIGVTHNFFSAGGDSIKSIQIISKMRSAGYELTVKDIFTSANIKELAQKLCRLTVQSDQSTVTGTAALTPIQQWFFNGPVRDKRHYNQSVMLHFPDGLTAEKVKFVFGKLQEHHDALRMVFTLEKGVTRTNRGLDTPVSLLEADLSHDPGALPGLCQRLQSEADLTTGPLMRLGLFHFPQGSRLLIVIHHLVVDGISWRILFEDINTLLEEPAAGRPLQLPAKTDSYLSWSDQLTAYTQTKSFSTAKAWWNSFTKKEAAPIRRDNPTARAIVKDNKTVNFRLTTEETTALLKNAHAAFGTQINDILLAALFAGIKERYGAGSVKIDLEAHGREPLHKAGNISRTVGWFTSIYPVLLECGSDSPAAVIRSVKETLRQVPNNGIDYLLIRNADPAGYKPAQLFFNYLGQFDADIQSASWQVSTEPKGDSLSPEEELEYDWEIIGLVAGGQMEMTLTYNTAQYNTETIHQLMTAYQRNLTAMIRYCTELPDSLQQQYAIEDIYPLSPMQESILFDFAMDPQSDSFFQQVSHTWKGELDIAAVEKSLDDLVARHSILRSIFIGKDMDRPLQAVIRQRKPAFTFTDMRQKCLLSSRDEVLRALIMEDKSRKFDLGADVMIRLSVYQTAEAEFELLWSYHHILMDGWCIGLIIQDFRAIYSANKRGIDPSLPPVKPYSQYIAWLEGADMDASRAYWKDYLSAYETQATLPKIDHPAVSGEPTTASECLVIGKEDTRLLHGICRENEVTVSTLLQMVWGILLSKYNRTRDVVFGSVVAGRPSELEGVENMVGLFINTIPVRIRYSSGDTIATLLRTVQLEALESQRFQYSPLSEVQSLTPLGRTLIDHLLVFENYPVADKIESGDVSDRFSFANVKIFEQPDYDFYLTMTPQEETRIHIGYKTAKYDGAVIKAVVSHLQRLIGHVMKGVDTRIDDMDMITAEEKSLILEGFNSPGYPLPEAGNVLDAFRRQVAFTPDAVAISEEVHKPLELWPSVSEFFIYDELLYAAMINDERRNAWYEKDIRANVKDKVVVEIGPGPEAILSRLCIEAGAKKVYAIEILEDTYRKAKAYLERMGLEQQIILIHGDATEVQLPELGDVLVSELVGPIGGSEGAAVILNNARRFLKDTGIMIPLRNITRIAPVSLPEYFTAAPGFSVVSGIYAEKVFEYLGRNADIRLCLRNFTRDWLLSDAEVFEELDFSRQRVEEEHTQEISFTIERTDTIQGFMLWLTLGSTTGEILDTMDYEHCWLPVFVPVFYPGAPVSKGDIIQAAIRRTVCENGINPDFIITGCLIHTDGRRTDFTYHLPHFPKAFRQDEFSRRIFSVDGEVAVLENKKRWLDSTYANLDRRSDALAARLRQLGVSAGTLSALLINNSAEAVLYMLAILKASGAYIPLDPQWPEGRVETILAEGRPQFCITNRKYHASITQRIPGDPGCALLLHEDLLADIARQADDPLPFAGGADSLAYIIFTSGSSGKPKGAMIPHRGLATLADAEILALDLQPGQRVLQFSSLAFDASVGEIYPTLCSGGTVVINNREAGFNIDRLHETLREAEINTAMLTPSVWRLLPGDNLPHLTTVVSAGEACDRSIVERWKPGRVFVNGYGPTECTVFATMAFPGDEIPDVISIGRPLANYKAVILGADNQLCPVQVPGELCISGNGVALGYLGSEALTKEKFIPNPFIPGQLMYRSGDLVKWLPDGSIAFLGRIDAQVKIRGFRIELGEIEYVLNSQEDITESVVLVRESEGNQFLVAWYVAPRPLDPVRLKAALAEKLPGYMVPAFYVHLEKLPLNTSGKTDRKALPDYMTGHLGDNYVAPATITEQKLVDIWTDVLKLSPASISVTGSFFDQGGHSLSAMLIVNKVRKQLGVDVPLNKFFEHQDIRSLAHYIRGEETTAFVAIEPAPHSDYYQLSSSQKRLYFLHVFNPASLAYNMPYMVRLEGRIDRRRLQDAFNRLVQRHESFRTCFRMVGNDVMQFIAGDIDFRLEDIEPRKGIPSMAGFVRPFPLDAAPLIRAGLCQLSAEEGYLMLDMHHIISDGMSQNVIIKDFLAFYNGEERPVLTLQYKDFSHWQQSDQRKEKIRHQKEFWLKEFAGEPGVLQLPTDSPRPAVKNFDGASLELGIGPDEIATLKSLADKEGSTLFMVLLALYNVLLHKLSGQDDIVIGTPVAGRPHTDLEKMVGMFVNTLSLRNFISRDYSFRDLLRVVRRRTLACLENQDYPYEELIEELNVDRDASRNPLFDAALIVQNFEEAHFTIPGLTLTPHDSDYGVSKFDIALVAEETNQRIKLSFVYATELFRKETIRRFAGCFSHILAAVTRDPEILLSDIVVISAAEQHRILHEFNDIRPGYGSFPGSTGKETIVSLFEAQVERTPEKTAVVFGDQRVSYRRLNAMADGIAGGIRQLAPGGRNVALLLPSSVEMIASIFGVLKAGCAYVPLNAAAPVERNRYILSDCRAGLLLTTAEHAGEYQAAEAILVIGPDGQGVRDVPDIPDWTDALHPGAVIAMDDICNIIYTSGTTGQPKGVEVMHKGIANFALWRNAHYQFTSADTILQLFSYFFDGYGANLFPCLLSGATLVITTETDRLDAGKIVDLIRAEGVSSMVLTPTIYGLILGELEARQEKAFVRSVTLAGERLPPELLAKAVDRMPGTEITNEYGLSETSVGATSYKVDGKAVFTGIPIGKPAANYTLYVMNGQHLQPIGVAGELCIGGEGVAKGYVNNETLTAEKFVPDPFRKGGRMFRTGDLARWLPDGNIDFIGRRDAQVKIRGFRIETGEIESRLAQHPAIDQAVVLARDSEDGKYLVAWYVSAGELDVTDIRKFLGAMLPDYMIPAYYVHLTSLPLGSTGKLDLKRLPEHRLKVIEHSAEATNDIQAKLIGIWADVLRVEPDRIGIHSNFFELGGHSINIVKMNSIINETFGCRISVANMFRLPTIKSIEDFITNGDQEMDKINTRLDQSAAEADANINLMTESLNGL